MRQLRMSDILKLNDKLLEQGYTQREIDGLVIYLGDDDELNGVHNAWFCQIIDRDKEDDNFFVETIDESAEGPATTFGKKCILIS